MKILYIDAFSGASGDMILGALLDLGVPLQLLEEELRGLKLEGFRIRAFRESRQGIHGTRVLVDLLHENRSHRSMREIRVMLERSSLAREVRDPSLRIFQRLAEAEGKIHGLPPEAVTFHEVGAVDSIVDIVGAVIGFNHLGPSRILASELPLGRGFVSGHHGRLPVPAPATLEILRGVPVRDGGVDAELVTPTGAAILREMAGGFGPMPPLSVEKIGYGAGHRDIQDRPNLLRFILGEQAGMGLREDWILEANIDDMNPEFCEHLMDRLRDRGAIDVSWSPLVMKKGRPGLLLKVLVDTDNMEAVSETILRESTSIGIRYYPVRRQCLERKHIRVRTPWGPVRIKVSALRDEVINALPEYEDCRKIAAKTSQPIKTIYYEALSAYHRKKPRD